MWLIDGLELRSELIVLIYQKVGIFFPKRQKRLKASKINKQRVLKFWTLEKSGKLWYSFNKYEVEGCSIWLENRRCRCRDS